MISTSNSLLLIFLFKNNGIFCFVFSSCFKVAWPRDRRGCRGRDLELLVLDWLLRRKASEWKIGSRCLGLDSPRFERRWFWNERNERLSDSAKAGSTDGIALRLNVMAPAKSPSSASLKRRLDQKGSSEGSIIVKAWLQLSLSLSTCGASKDEKGYMWSGAQLTKRDFRSTILRLEFQEPYWAI